MEKISAESRERWNQYPAVHVWVCRMRRTAKLFRDDSRCRNSSSRMFRRQSLENFSGIDGDARGTRVHAIVASSAMRTLPILQPVFLQFAIESGSSDAEQLGGKRAVAFCHLKRMEDGAFLDFREWGDAGRTVASWDDKKLRDLMTSQSMSSDSRLTTSGRKIGPRKPWTRVHGDHLLDSCAPAGGRCRANRSATSSLHHFIGHAMVVAVTREKVWRSEPVYLRGARAAGQGAAS